MLGAALQQVFGMAEGLLNYTRLDDPDDVICTTQGRPLSPGDEVRLVDELGNDVPEGEPGSLLTRGPYTPRGYYRAAEQNTRAFTADGWYRSGDIVRRRPDGNLVVEGRDKDMINRGGEKISAEEVENLMYQLPQVAQVAAVAMPDPELGERVCVYAVLAPGQASPSTPCARRWRRPRPPASSGPSGSSSSPNCPPRRSARSTRRRCAPTSPRGWPASEEATTMTSAKDETTAVFDSPGHQAKLAELSVLAEGHGTACLRLASRDDDRFADVGWEAGPDSSVYIHDSSAWLDCSVYDEIRAGDHTIALLEIHGLRAAPRTPLIFHGSQFRKMAAV